MSKREEKKLKKEFKGIQKWFDLLPEDLRTSRVYCESILIGSKHKITKELEKNIINEDSMEGVVSKMLVKGAKLEDTEDEFLHWITGHLLNFGQLADRLTESNDKKKLMTAIHKCYEEVQNTREKFIGNRINQTLKINEEGFLFIGQGHLGIEKFISDDINVKLWDISKLCE